MSTRRPVRAYRLSAAGLLLGIVLALPGCTTAGSPAGTDPTTEESTSTMATYASQDEALAEVRDRAVALRDELVAAFTPSDPDAAREHHTDGEISCTMGGPGPVGWDAGAGFLADDPQGQAEAQIARLEQDGWQRVGADREVNETVGRDGWSVTLAWDLDASAVTVSVHSPCYDEDGVEVGGDVVTRSG